RPIRSLTFFLLLHSPPPSTLFPYTTLFRSHWPASHRLAQARRTASSGNIQAPREFAWAPHQPVSVRGHTTECDYTILHGGRIELDRKSTRLNSSHLGISYAVFCLKKKK